MSKKMIVLGRSKVADKKTDDIADFNPKFEVKATSMMRESIRLKRVTEATYKKALKKADTDAKKAKSAANVAYKKGLAASKSKEKESEKYRKAQARLKKQSK